MLIILQFTMPRSHNIILVLIVLVLVVSVDGEFKSLIQSSPSTNPTKLHQRLTQAKQHNKNQHKDTIQQMQRDRIRYELLHSAIDSNSNTTSDRSIQLSIKHEYLHNTIKRKGLQKLQTLLTETKSIPLYSVSSNQFMSLIHDGPRPYWTLVSLTALNSINNCQQCVIVNELIKPVADAYNRQYNQYYDMNNNIYNKLDNYTNNDIPIFFLNVDVSRNQQIFNELNLKHAPVLVLLPPTLSDKTKKLSKFLDVIPSKYKLNTLSSTPSLNDIIAFISRHTGINTVNVDSGVLEKQPTFMDAIIPLTALILLGVVIFYKYNTLLQLRDYSYMSSILQVGGWIFYMYCMSGGMYNSIRGTIWADYDQKSGTTKYINSEVRDQFASEGYMMGTCMVISGAMIVMMCNKAFVYTVVDRTQANKSVNNPSTWYAPVLVLIDYIFRPAISGAIAILAWYAVLAVYSMKNRGYNFGVLY